MNITIVAGDLAGDDHLRLIDDASGWPEVDELRLPKRSKDGLAPEALLLIIVVVLAAAKVPLAIARTVKYIQDNFHRAVLVDFSGDEPQVKALPEGPGMRGRTFIQQRSGTIELAPNVEAPDLADEIKALMPTE